MTEYKRKHILCAVRGQPKSRGTATRAIDLALEHDARLTFVWVIDIQFLSQAAPTMSPISVIYNQLQEMGEFSMLILCDRAERRGVKQVDYMIRKGGIADELLQIALESRADMMVLGRPVRELGQSIFTPDRFAKFVKEVEQKAGLEVIEV